MGKSCKCNHVPNDIENPSLNLEVLMKQELDSVPPISAACCISRVPQRLRLANEKVYAPQVVSIGPLHHGKESLKAMEEHKKRYLKNFLQRTNMSLEHYINIIKGKEASLRNSYAEPIGFRSDELIKMVLVDGGFVVEVLLMNWFDELPGQHGDNLFNKPWMLQDVFPDLWLLENQLPFFILEDLLLTVPSDATERLSIGKLCFKFFKRLTNFDREWHDMEKINSSKILHFVDFVRILYVPLNMDPHARGKLKTLAIPSVSELIQSGVIIKASSTTNFFDLRFSNGVLEIPKVVFTYATELTIRNILAFEQHHCRDRYMNDYAMVMNRLVTTPTDVDFLVKHGILEDKVGNSVEVSNFANRIARELIVNFKEFYFATVCEELNAYCQAPWNNWNANLKQNYFNTPWAIVSVIAASLLIVLTIIQAVCSVLSATNGYGNK